ncbi:MAG TPA: Rrf2 family transcriptional regulator [Gemmataceae bacterium]|nr:Rrf2 family transcriptional regulator [Gemmataceae bacterium]
MLFSAKAEYACVAMLELAARHSDPRPARLADIADKHGIPQRFLVQILLDLKRAGLVASTRGAAGGYALAKSPDDISLFDILTVIDPPEQPARQNDPLQPTVFVHNVRAVWDKVVEAQQAILKETTLADLAQKSQGLQYVI